MLPYFLAHHHIIYTCSSLFRNQLTRHSLPCTLNLTILRVQKSKTPLFGNFPPFSLQNNFEMLVRMSAFFLRCEMFSLSLPDCSFVLCAFLLFFSFCSGAYKSALIFTLLASNSIWPDKVRESMVNYKLHYFNWRGCCEGLRLMFRYAKVPYVDQKYEHEEFDKHREGKFFGSLQQLISH